MFCILRHDLIRVKLTVMRLIDGVLQCQSQETTPFITTMLLHLAGKLQIASENTTSHLKRKLGWFFSARTVKHVDCRRMPGNKPSFKGDKSTQSDTSLCKRYTQMVPISFIFDNGGQLGHLYYCIKSEMYLEIWKNEVKSYTWPAVVLKF